MRGDKFIQLLIGLNFYFAIVQIVRIILVDGLLSERSFANEGSSDDIFLRSIILLGISFLIVINLIGFTVTKMRPKVGNKDGETAPYTIIGLAFMVLSTLYYARVFVEVGGDSWFNSPRFSTDMANIALSLFLMIVGNGMIIAATLVARIK